MGSPSCDCLRPLAAAVGDVACFRASLRALQLLGMGQGEQSCIEQGSHQYSGDALHEAARHC